MKRTPAFRLALCGILAALAVALMMLGGSLSVAIYCCPMLACLLLVPLRELCSAKLCVVWYAAVSILSLLLCPDKEPAIVFCFLGWYPLAAESLSKLPKGLRMLVKLLIFNAAVAAMYALMLFVFRMDAIVSEFQTTALPLLVLLLVLANAVFIVLDLLLQRMREFFRRRFGGK